MKANTPYVKNYENGILVNPITKENPYLFATIAKLEKLSRGLKYWGIVRNRFFTGRQIVKY